MAEPQGSLAQEWASWMSPSPTDLSPTPQPGQPAPQTDQLVLPTDKPTLLVFLRHCGCPWAEKTFKDLLAISAAHPSQSLNCLAISHSSPEATDNWLASLGGSWSVAVTPDPSRALYALYGLPAASTPAWHVISPLALYRTLQLGRTEGVWNRPTESGSRWQTGGAFAVDAGGVVRWAHVAASADDIGDLGEGLRALGIVEDGKKEEEEKGDGRPKL